MRKLSAIVVCGILLALGACEDIREELSDTLKTEGVIREVAYEPSYSHLTIDIDFDGDVGLKTVTEPEHFLVTIAWEHGVFTLYEEDIYEKFKEYKGREVDVLYHEVYRTTYKKNGDGKMEATQKTFLGYRFIDATVLK